MATFSHDGHQIYFEMFGSGPRVLFFNGSGATIEGSRLLIERLAKWCEVVVHDQRGLGLTGYPSNSQYSMADYARDGAALLDHIGWDESAVVGISFGGMVALEFAVTWPQRVQRLALLCTSPGGAGGSSYPLHELVSKDQAERRRIMPLLTDSRFTAEWLATHDLDRQVVEYQRAGAESPKDETRAAGEAAQLAARRHHDVWSRLGSITSPTFIAAGRYDRIAPPENSEAMASEIAHSQLHLYEGGHIFVLQDRRAMSDLRAFLTS